MERTHLVAALMAPAAISALVVGCALDQAPSGLLQPSDFPALEVLSHTDLPNGLSPLGACDEELDPEGLLIDAPGARTEYLLEGTSAVVTSGSYELGQDGVARFLNAQAQLPADCTTPTSAVVRLPELESAAATSAGLTPHAVVVLGEFEGGTPRAVRSLSCVEDRLVVVTVREPEERLDLVELTRQAIERTQDDILTDTVV